MLGGGGGGGVSGCSMQRLSLEGDLQLWRRCIPLKAGAQPC